MAKGLLWGVIVLNIMHHVVRMLLLVLCHPSERDTSANQVEGCPKKSTVTQVVSIPGETEVNRLWAMHENE